MFQKGFIFIVLLLGFSIQSQTISSEFKTKTLEIKNDTIQLDSVPINPQKFKLFDALKNEIPTLEYSIDFNKAKVIIN